MLFYNILQYFIISSLVNLTPHRKYGWGHGKHMIVLPVCNFKVPDTSVIPTVTGDHAGGVLPRPPSGGVMVHINPHYGTFKAKYENPAIVFLISC